MENEIETSKNRVDQIFTGKNKKKTSRIFYLFRGLHCRCFFNGIFLIYRSIFGPAVTHTLKSVQSTLSHLQSPPERSSTIMALSCKMTSLWHDLINKACPRLPSR